MLPNEAVLWVVYYSVFHSSFCGNLVTQSFALSLTAFIYCFIILPSLSVVLRFSSSQQHRCLVAFFPIATGVDKNGIDFGSFCFFLQFSAPFALPHHLIWRRIDWRDRLLYTCIVHRFCFCSCSLFWKFFSFFCKHSFSYQLQCHQPHTRWAVQY